MQKFKILLLFALFVCSSVQAQKIKYKDLFYLLETGNYKDGEPLLKTFLSDPKNADNGNANLQMAYIYQKKAESTDVILDAEALTVNVDSAIFFYNKAIQFIDEKELKKNDEFYQAFQRRDIRTGKFGVKLADIQFDIENRTKALNDRKDKVLELQIYYSKANETYTKAVGQFKRIKGEYPTKKILYLRSNEELLKEVAELKSNVTIAIQNFDYYQSTLKKIDKPGYAPVRHMKEILDYERDGESMALLTSDNVDIWDFGKWADEVEQGVKNNITPLRDELIEYDKGLDLLLSRVIEDSMSVSDKLKPLNALSAKMREYDSDPLPEYIFRYKTAEIKRLSAIMENLDSLNSEDIVYQLTQTKKNVASLAIMDSMVNLLVSRNINEDFKNYKTFITTQYQGQEGFQNYIRGLVDNVMIQKKIATQQADQLDERAKWLIGESDSIPLFKEVNVGLSKYVPLYLDENLTAGLYFSGKTPAEGYFATITNTRRQELKVTFKIDTEHFKKQNIEATQTLLASDPEGHFYYLMFYAPIDEKEEYAASLCKVYTSDGLAWEKNVLLETRPTQMIINKNTGDLIVEYDMENYVGAVAINDRKVFDKKGAEKP